MTIWASVIGRGVVVLRTIVGVGALYLRLRNRRPGPPRRSGRHRSLLRTRTWLLECRSRTLCRRPLARDRLESAHLGGEPDCRCGLLWLAVEGTPAGPLGVDVVIAPGWRDDVDSVWKAPSPARIHGETHARP